MIKSIRVKNIAVIKDIEIEFGEGLNILTGETGAGKSIIVDSIKFLLGSKRGKELIREGEERAVVEAEFKFEQYPQELSHFGIDETDGEIHIRREIHRSGKSKILINGMLVTASILKEISDKLIAIYGQRESTFLLNPAYYREYIDLFIEKKLVEKIIELYSEVVKLRAKLEEIEKLEKEKGMREEFLRFSIKEIEETFLDDNEENELKERRKILKDFTKINFLIADILKFSKDDEISILSLLSEVKNRFLSLAKYKKEWEDSYRVIEKFEIEFEELLSKLEHYISGVEFSPREADEVEEKLRKWEDVLKKYGGDREKVKKFLNEAKEELYKIETSEVFKEELLEKLNEIENEYFKLADKLSKERNTISKKIEKLVESTMKDLGVKNPKFVIDIETKKEKVTPFGFDEVRFLFSANIGSIPKPIEKIASGGELSRLMLALKIHEKKFESLTYVFDEVDSGVGGRTAEKVGEKLKEVALKNQTIVITHFPQVASYADYHFKIEKYEKDKETIVKVRKLENSERVEEIARMMAGTKITEHTIKSAEELLKR